jgi:NADH-quinone oxidoreductase subunit G
MIATDMTRCIHCTRCVRFGQEIAGLMELGGTGRGEHMEIGTWVENSVDSELSGNMIDLCPVGALTSKPFRFTARTWELQDTAAVLSHDTVGSSVWIQSLRGEVRRVLPRENPDVNEIWLADRDRFSYTGLEADDRLRTPRIREAGKWRECDWNTALEFAASGLAKARQAHGGHSLAALAAPGCTTEEFYLLAQLMRGLGSNSVDHRLRQRDFSAQLEAPLLGRPIAELNTLGAALLVGSYLRKEQPILAARMRRAALDGARISVLGPLQYDFNFPLARQIAAAPRDMAAVLARVLVAVARHRGVELPAYATVAGGAGEPREAEIAIARELYEAGADGSVLIGQQGIVHENFGTLRTLASALAEVSGARLGILGEGNGVGAHLAGCVPYRDANGDALAQPGMDPQRLAREGCRGLVLLGVEPDLDCVYGSALRKVAADADFTVALASFVGEATDYADVLLPVASLGENEGSFVNCEGRRENFSAAVAPAGEAKPAWKVLRVLGDKLGCGGFGFVSLAEVRDRIRWEAPAVAAPAPLAELPQARAESAIEVERILEVPMYAQDALLRRAGPLQRTADNPPVAARMHPDVLQRLGLTGCARVNVHSGADYVTLDLVADERVPAGSVLIPTAVAETTALDAAGWLRVVGA